MPVKGFIVKLVCTIGLFIGMTWGLGGACMSQMSAKYLFYNLMFF